MHAHTQEDGAQGCVRAVVSEGGGEGNEEHID